MGGVAQEIMTYEPRGGRVDIVPEQARKQLEHRTGLPEDQDEHQGEEEVRHRLEEGGGRQHPLDRRAAAPGHQSTDRGAADKAQDGREAKEAQGPWQVGGDEAAHWGVLGPRMPEGAASEVSDVLEALVAPARMVGA